MPRLDGYQATARLRAAVYDRPIIALTAHAMKEERERCMALGFSDHLTKPIRQRELMARIKRHGLGVETVGGTPPPTSH
jgi:CheY-like chemotaxis protein